MGLRSGLGTLLEVLAVVLIVAMIAGQALGQPVLLSYVTTDSMEPTLHPGDGFVAIPAAVSGEIEEGDVITFRAKTLNGGGLTTHRVVEVTERGFITKGDANPFTDQDGEEPPVKRTQVVATAWQPGGTVLSIPGVGTVVTGTQSTLRTVQRTLAATLGTRSLLGTQGLAYILLALSIVGYVLDLWLSRGGKQRARDRDRDRDDGIDIRVLMAVFAAVVVVGATASMIGPAGAQEIGVVSAESDSPGIGVIETGTSESVNYPVGNGGLLPAVVFFETNSEAVDVSPGELAVPSRSTTNVSLTVSAPPQTGYYRYYVVQHRYLAILPQSTIRGLYTVHPWLPLVAINAILGGGFYLVGMALVGTGRIRSRSHDRPQGLLDRLT